MIKSYGSGILAFRRFLSFFILFLTGQQLAAQAKDKGVEALFTPPESYVAHFTKEPPIVDGDISDAMWQGATWTELFQDIEGSRMPVPAWKTRIKMLWNDSCLFVAAALQEPHVWASLKQHDAIIYQDNDFEIFIDPDGDTHQYFEIEVNAFNTIFDLFMPKPYRNGGNALIPYDVAGLQSAVRVYGTLNNPTDTDSGWAVEMAIPFRSLAIGNSRKAPEDGALWRINFSRVQWDTDIINGAYHKKKNQRGKNVPEHNWVWSPQGLINMHYPERWGFLLFAKNNIANRSFTLPYEELQRQYLWRVYYRQKDYHSKNGRYARSLKEIGWSLSASDVEGRKNKIEMEATSRQFSVLISDGANSWMINDEGLIKPVKPAP